jgi:hypothetical protein
LGHNAGKKLAKSELKTGAKSDRGWRQIAGPDLSPTSFHAATLPLEISPAAANAAFTKYWTRTARRCLFKRNTPPVNVVGGYRFPNAPEIDLSLPTPESPIAKMPSTAEADLTIPDDLSIPAFLLRHGGRDA